MMRLLDDSVQSRRTCIALVIYLGVVSTSEEFTKCAPQHESNNALGSSSWPSLWPAS